MSATLRRLNPNFTFLALALLVNVVASAAAASVTDPARHRLAEFGAMLDMTVTVTALYWWLVVRPGLRPGSSLVFVAVMGLLRAAFAYPHLVPGKAIVGAGAEISLVLALIVGFRRARHLQTAQPESDPAEIIHSIVAGFIPFRAAGRALAGELSILYYAFAWRAKPHVPAGSTAFTLHKRDGFSDLVLMVGLVSLLEVLPVHLLLARWSVTAAWVMTGLSFYGAIWAVALGRSFSRRPTLVNPDEIVIRFGLLFTLRVPVNAIRAVGRNPFPNAILVPRNTPATLYIEFTHPLQAQKILGFTRTVTAIGLSPDDDKAFELALNH